MAFYLLNTGNGNTGIDLGDYGYGFNVCYSQDSFIWVIKLCLAIVWSAGFNKKEAMSSPVRSAKRVSSIPQELRLKSFSEWISQWPQTLRFKRKIWSQLQMLCQQCNVSDHTFKPQASLISFRIRWHLALLSSYSFLFQYKVIVIESIYWNLS